MRIGCFDPLAPFDIDNFAFDFTADVGAQTMVSTLWTCALAPYQTGFDPAPQSRILAVSTQTMIETRDPLTNTSRTKSGFFSVATIGGLPASAAGSTYELEATLVLSDGRVLSLSSTILCSAG